MLVLGLLLYGLAHFIELLLIGTLGLLAGRRAIAIAIKFQ